jgi:hypothetical protein
VLRGDGQVLLAAGTVLDGETIAHLFERGVEMIWIAVDDTRDDATRAQESKAADAHVRHLFRGPSNAVRDELRDAVLTHRQQQVG